MREGTGVRVIVGDADITVSEGIGVAVGATGAIDVRVIVGASVIVGRMKTVAVGVNVAVGANATRAISGATITPMAIDPQRQPRSAPKKMARMIF